MASQRPAPVFLNLFRIRFPVGAVTSFAHRVAGALLFLSFPWMVYLLDLSLRGPEGYARAAAILQSGWVRVGAVILIWSLAHHLMAGIRFLLIDIETGVALPQARVTAWLVNFLGFAAVLVYLGWVL